MFKVNIYVFWVAMFISEINDVSCLLEVDMFFDVNVLQSIMKTCPCNLYPLTSHFYIVKLGLTGVYMFFLFLL